MRWQVGDLFLNTKKPEILYKVLSASETTYLLITKPMSIRVILPHEEIEGPEWIKYEGEVYGQNTVQKDKKKRRDETSNPVQKRHSNSDSGNRPGGTPASGSNSTHRSGKPSTRKWWKRKKKGLRRKKSVNKTNKGL